MIGRSMIANIDRERNRERLTSDRKQIRIKGLQTWDIKSILEGCYYE